MILSTSLSRKLPRAEIQDSSGQAIVELHCRFALCLRHTPCGLDRREQGLFGGPCFLAPIDPHVGLRRRVQSQLQCREGNVMEVAGLGRSVQKLSAAASRHRPSQVLYRKSLGHTVRPVQAVAEDIYVCASNDSEQMRGCISVLLSGTRSTRAARSAAARTASSRCVKSGEKGSHTDLAVDLVNDSQSTSVPSFRRASIPEFLRLTGRYLPFPESRSMSRLHPSAIQWRVQRA